MEATRLTEKAHTLKKPVLDIISGHIGQPNAITAKVIGIIASSIREAIRLLRKEGHLILSTVKPPYGYFMASSLQEWVEFRDRNLRPRALDILHTAQAMGLKAQEVFGGQQTYIIPKPMSHFSLN